jgi:hypothetical protein
MGLTISSVANGRYLIKHDNSANFYDFIRCNNIWSHILAAICGLFYGKCVTVQLDEDPISMEKKPNGLLYGKQIFWMNPKDYNFRFKSLIHRKLIKVL